MSGANYREPVSASKAASHPSGQRAGSLWAFKNLLSAWAPTYQLANSTQLSRQPVIQPTKHPACWLSSQPATSHPANHSADQPACQQAQAQSCDVCADFVIFSGAYRRFVFSYRLVKGLRNFFSGSEISAQTGERKRERKEKLRREKKLRRVFVTLFRRLRTFFGCLRHFCFRACFEKVTKTTKQLRRPFRKVTKTASKSYEDNTLFKKKVTKGERMPKRLPLKSYEKPLPCYFN